MINYILVSLLCAIYFRNSNRQDLKYFSWDHICVLFHNSENHTSDLTQIIIQYNSVCENVMYVNVLHIISSPLKIHIPECLFMSMEPDCVSELRPPMVLLFIRQVM
jgi:hypothetical protein